MKTNYSKKWLYAFAVIFAALVVLTALIKTVTTSEAIWYLALFTACFTLGGCIALSINYFRKTSSAWSAFSAVVWVISGVALAVSLAYIIVYGKETLSIACLCLSVVLFVLLNFVYRTESTKETDAWIDEMHRKTDKRIARMKKEFAKLNA